MMNEEERRDRNQGVNLIGFSYPVACIIARASPAIASATIL